MDPKIYAKLRKLAMAAAARAGASDAWMEDIADEAITKLIEQLEPPDNAEAWIQTVATNLAREQHRKHPPRRRGRMPLSNPDRSKNEKPYPRSLAEPSPSLDVRRRMQVKDVLARLEPVEAEMLLLQAAGMTNAEIATKLGYSEGSVRSKIWAARAKTKRRFPDVDNFDA